MLGTNLQEIIFGTKILQFLKKGKLTESLQSIQNPARLKFGILCHEFQHFKQNKAKNHRKELLEKRVPDLQRVYGITFQIKVAKFSCEASGLESAKQSRKNSKVTKTQEKSNRTIIRLFFPGNAR